MNLFRKFLVKLRAAYNKKPETLFIVSGAVLLVSAIAGVIVDLFVPFGAWWNLIRTVVLIPLSLSMFILGYSIGLLFHYSRRQDPNWRPYRTRFSPAWRRRISLMVGALGLVMIYAGGESAAFTFLSSLFLAVVIALFAFIRLSPEEQKRDEFGLPDARDISYENKIKDFQNKRAEAAQAKKDSKPKKKSTGRMFKPLGSKNAEDQI